MEKSDLGTLKPCLNPTLNFPTPRHRRPLRSQTYCTFVRILSHCHALQTSFKPRSEDGNESDKLGEADEPIANEDCMEVESSSVQQMSPVDGAKDVKLVEIGKHVVSESFMEVESSLIQQISPINGVKDALKDLGSVTTTQGTEQLTPGHGVKPSNSSRLSNLSTVVENCGKLSPRVEQNAFDRFLDNEVYDAANQPTSMERFSDTQSNKVSPRRDQDVFSIPFISEAYEAASQPTSMEVIGGMPENARSFNEKNPGIVADFSEGFQDQLQLKQHELEELLSASGELDLSVYDIDNEQIEEGEILGGYRVDDKAMNLLFEDDASLKEKKLDEVLVSEVDERELVNANDGDREIGKNNIEDQVEGSRNIMKIGTRIREEQNTNPNSSRENGSFSQANGYDYNLESGWLTKQVSGVNNSNNSVISLQNDAQRRQITYEDISENRGAATAPMEVKVAKKRRKGPLTEERKAKKKKNYRIKRAEKNKKLGVRRLKLQPPVLKPKKVVYCRHYLQGRCHEGEKCKFSHDITPVTKSTPCSFFARHSCMKGDDCPFDHELSKYPCNNIVTKGFCSRGAECLFKHEVASTKDASLISHFSKPESSSPFPLTNDFKNQVNKEGITDQRINAKLPSKDNSIGKVSQNQVLKNLELSVAHVPKGIAFVSPAKPRSNTSEHDGASPHLKADNQMKTSSSIASNLSSSLKKSNESLDNVPMKTPKGINFLSIGKSPIDDYANMKRRASGSLLGLSTNHGVVGFSPSNDGGVKTDNEATVSCSESASAVNKIAMEVQPDFTPQDIKFLSVGSVALNNVNSSVIQSSNSFDNVNSGRACIQGKQNSVEAFTFLSRTANGSSSSSSHPLGQSLNQDTRFFGEGNSNSSSKASVLLNMPTSIQSALHHSLDFAANIESKIKLDRSAGNPFSLSRK